MGLRHTLGLIAMVGACAQPGRTDEPRRTDEPATATSAAAAATTANPAAPTAAASTSAAAVVAPPAARCIEGGTPYDLAVMRERVTMLSAPGLDGRMPGKPGDATTRAFIAERFACLGLVPASTDGSYEQPFSDDGDPTANVLGYVKGTDATGDIIAVVAHHDHIGGGLLGANDNASGVVALLAIAQAVQQRDQAPKRTILFATFGAEERGMKGSYHFVANPPATIPLARIVQVINLDMVGTHASRGFVAAMGTFRGLGATGVLSRLRGDYPKLEVGLGGVARGSDHEPFCKQGIPYVFFWTPDKRCYHKKCDTADKLDYPRMVDIAALAGDLTEALADSELDLAGLRTRRGCGL